MFERIFFSLSMFVFKLFQGLSGVVVAKPLHDDEPLFPTNVAEFQDYQIRD